MNILPMTFMGCGGAEIVEKTVYRNGQGDTLQIPVDPAKEDRTIIHIEANYQYGSDYLLEDLDGYYYLDMFSTMHWEEDSAKYISHQNGGSTIYVSKLKATITVYVLGGVEEIRRITGHYGYNSYGSASGTISPPLSHTDDTVAVSLSFGKLFPIQTLDEELQLPHTNWRTSAKSGYFYFENDTDWRGYEDQHPTEYNDTGDYGIAILKLS